MKLNSLTFYPNGNVSARDEEVSGPDQVHEEVPMHNWMTLYFKYLESKGIDPAATPMLAVQHTGDCVYVKAIKVPEGWSYELLPIKTY